MNVIIAYLETMFSAYPQSPRLIEAKAELQTMMEDAYTGFIAEGVSENEAVGRVITEFGNLDELAPVLGITGDLAPSAPTLPIASRALAAGAALPSSAPAAPQAPLHPAITLEQAKGFAEAHERTRFRLGTAVSLFVLSPIAIITLPTLSEAGILPFAANVASLIGLLLLFVLVATGVMMLIGVSRDFTPYAMIRDGRFTRNPVVTIWANDLAQQHDRARIRALQIAVMLWVLSPAPVLFGSLIPQGSERQDLWSVLGVAGLLVMVAAGLFTLLPANWANSVAEAIGQPAGSSANGDDDDHSIVGIIASFYWPLAVVIYLAWSFIGDAWGISWIIWPIAGVLFGALAGGFGAIEAYRKQRR